MAHHRHAHNQPCRRHNARGEIAAVQHGEGISIKHPSRKRHNAPLARHE